MKGGEVLTEGLLILGTMLQGKDTRNPEWKIVRIDADGNTYQVMAKTVLLGKLVQGQRIIAKVNAVIEEYRGVYKIGYMLVEMAAA